MAGAGADAGAPPGFRFPKAARVRRRAEFLSIQESGRRFPSGRLLVLVRDDAPGTARRLGVVASKKVGGATVRNRAKRLVREAFRTHPEWFRGETGTTVVVVVRPGGDLDATAVAHDFAAAHRAWTAWCRRRGKVGRPAE